MANGCPLPALGDALAPYIRPSHEVQSIRGNLHKYLEKNLNLDDECLTNNNLTSPAIAVPLPDAPARLQGVRKAYWNALKAHQEAQAKYASLKAEIEELSKTKSTSQSQQPDNVQHNVLPLLRQREKQRKLEVVAKALSRTTEDSAGPANVTTDEFVKTRAGVMPLLPNVSSTRHGHVEEADSRMLELKKAILTAKHVLETHSDTSPDGDSSHSPQAELYALQQTRNMLINWIEKQLTVIGDAQGAAEKPIETLVVEGEDAPIPVSRDEIGQIYTQYLAARKKLLQTLQHPAHHPFSTAVPITNGRLSPSPRAIDKTGSMAAAMLPYIQSLLDLQSTETTLSKQTVYSRKQIDTAKMEIDRLIRRLADESHLVAPGARQGKDWLDASDIAEKSVTETVKERLQDGGRAAKSAHDLLQRFDALPEAFVESS